MKKIYTPNGRNIEDMERFEIIEYLGMDDNISDKLWEEIIEQAKVIEKIYNNKMVDYCLKTNYKQEVTDIIIGKTRDLIIFIRQEDED